MHLDKVIKERRSIRSFSSEIPSDDQINRILESLLYVPSPTNSQPLELIVIRSAEKKQELKGILQREYDKLYESVSAHWDRKRVKLLKSYWRFALTMFNAPVIIAAGIGEYKKISDILFTENRETKSSGDIYLGASLYGISLSAQSERLASCIYTSPLSLIDNPELLNEFLGINLSAFITLGYPDESPEALNKKDLKDMVRYI